jgi:hypothetical protein
MILHEYTCFPPRLYVNTACVIGQGSIIFFNQRGCAVKTALETVFFIVFLLEELVVEV